MIRFLQTPGPIKKIVLGGILLLISGAMVITLVPGGLLGDYMGSNVTEQGVLARVGDDAVTTAEVNKQAQNILRQETARGNLPPALMPFFRQQALQRAADGLIMQKALELEAQRMGLKVSDEELADEICHGQMAPELCPKGVPVGQDQYQNLVANFQMTIPEFEQAYKEELLVNKLQALVAGGVSVSGDEVRQEFARKNVKVKLEYAVLDLEQVSKQIKPTDTELKAYFDQNKARYAESAPEKRQARYVVVDANQLRDQVAVSQADLQRYYDDRRDQFRVGDRANVRHILIKIPAPGPDGKTDPKAVDAARAKGESILKQLRAGADFAALAKKYSEDEASKDNGGSLGWIERGRTENPDFEQAAFSLPKGQVSDLVRSSQGFHIIRVDDKQNAHIQSLDEVKAQIEPQVRDDKAARAVDSLANALQNEAGSLGLQKAAAKHNLQVITSEYFSRTDSLPGIGAAPDFMDAVFSAAEKTPPSLVRIPSGYAIFELAGIKPAAAPTFDQSRARVESDFRQERGAQLLERKIQELSDRAKAAHDLKKAAKELGATLKTSDFVGPDGQVPDIGALTGQAAVAFSMKVGQISGPIAGDRDGIVLSVAERREPDPADYDKQKDQLREGLLQQKRGQYMNLFASSLVQRLEKEGKIRKNKQEWDRLMKVSESPGE